MKVNITKLIEFANELEQGTSDVELKTFLSNLFVASNTLHHISYDMFDEDERHEIASAFYFVYKFVERMNDVIESPSEDEE